MVNSLRTNARALVERAEAEVRDCDCSCCAGFAADVVKFAESVLRFPFETDERLRLAEEARNWIAAKAGKALHDVEKLKRENASLRRRHSRSDPGQDDQTHVDRGSGRG